MAILLQKISLMPMPNRRARQLFIVIYCCLFGALLIACSPAPDRILQRNYETALIYAAAISDDASFSVVSADGLELLMWHRNEASPRFRLQHSSNEQHSIRAIDISADGEFIGAASARNFSLWRSSNGESVGYWQIPTEADPELQAYTEITSMAVSNGGAVIALGLNTGKVIIFNPFSGRRLEMLVHSDYITSLAIAPNGKYVLSGSLDKQAVLWNTDTAALIHQLSFQRSVMQVAMHPSGQWLFVADNADRAEIYAGQSGTRISRLQFNDRKRSFSSAVFSPDGHYLLTGTPSQTVDIWAVETGERLTRFEVSVGSSGRPNAATVLALGVDPQRQTIWTENSAGISELWSWPLPSP